MFSKISFYVPQKKDMHDDRIIIFLGVEYSFNIFMKSFVLSGVRVRFIGAGLCSGLFGLPALVSVDELCQIGCFLRIAHDELVFQQLFGCRSLRERQKDVRKCEMGPLIRNLSVVI